MRDRQRLLAGGIALWLLLLPSAADACSCGYVGPPCQAFWSAEAVLDATVLEQRAIPREQRVDSPPTFHDDTIVSLNVHAAYQGASVGRLDVTTYSSSSACGYPFKTGSRYLIFARRAPTGMLTVSLCSATQTFDGKGPAADFLASFSEPPRGGRIYGTVQTFGAMFRGNERTPIATEIRLTGPDGVQTVRSDGGRYEFTGLAVGRYHLDALVPEGYDRSVRTQSVEIADLRGCAEWSMTFSPAGRISGRAVDAEGRPLATVRIEVVPADAQPTENGLSPHSVTSQSDGSFELAGLGAGRYIVGVNLDDLPSDFRPHPRTTYPGAGLDPLIIELALGQAADLGTFTIPPPLPVARVAGRVVRADGSGVAGVYVSAWDETGNPVSRLRGAGGATTDAEGRFELSLRQGRLYEFTVRAGSESLRISAPRVEVTAEPRQAIQIVLVPPAR